MVGAAEDALDLRAAAPARDDRELAPLGASQRLAVEDERNAGREVGLADDELAASRDLDDDPGRIGRI